MNTDQGTFVALPARPARVGIITHGCGLNRTVLWLDDYSFQTVHFLDLIEAKRPPKQEPKFFKYNGNFPYLHFVPVVFDDPTVLCSSCSAKSADCAYGQLRGAQSCMDTRERFEKK